MWVFISTRRRKDARKNRGGAKGAEEKNCISLRELCAFVRNFFFNAKTEGRKEKPLRSSERREKCIPHCDLCAPA